MISLYSRLAGQWDELFPPDHHRELYLELLLKSLGNPTRILELGCGTGATARYLAGRGFSVRATDPDPEMLAVAAASDSSGVKFGLNDMLGTLDTAAPAAFDAILCLGNTLPHLGSFDELDRFFQSSNTVLSKSGRMVIQILNYGRIISAGRIDMPDIDTNGLVFRRRQEYDAESHSVTFRTELLEGDRSEHRDHTMLPIGDDDLIKTANRHSFGLLELNSAWNASSYSGAEPWFVAVFEKLGSEG